MIAAVLTETEREQLHGLLRKIMRAFPDKDHGLKLGVSDATEASADTGPGDPRA
jgi:hypothetical protein